MAKGSSRRAPDVNQRIRELQSDITSAGNFSKDSIKEAAITDLFKPMLNQDIIQLTAPSFDNPDENSLQVTAVAALFAKNIKITAVFVVDKEDKLSMTMNTYEKISMLLDAIYSAGLVPGDYKPGYIPPVPIDGLSFIFDAAASGLTLKGEGEDWKFLGYANLYVKKPTLTLARKYDKGLVTNTWKASGTLTSDTAQVNIPISLQLPIGVVGWNISAGPVTLDNGLGIIDALTGISVSGLLPQGFTNLLANIEITNFFAAFDPATKALSSVQLQVQTKAAWIITEGKLKIEEGINLLLGAQRFNQEDPLSFSGSITGAASVNYADPEEEVQASAEIPVPLTGNDWTITLANDESPLGIGKLVALAPGVKGFLPDTLYDKLNEIVLEFLTIKFRFDNGFSFTSIAFAIHSANEWQLPFMQGSVYLDKEFRLALDIPLPYKFSTTTGELSGVLQIDSGNVSIPVRLAKTPENEHWNLVVTSDEIPLPSISQLSGFMGLSVLNTASPSGLMQIGNFSIFNLELAWQFGTPSKLLRFAFTIRSTPDTPAWNLVPGYFGLTELFASIAIDNKSVADKDTSGSIGATVTWILNKDKESKLVFFMQATKPSSNDPWKFNGGLKEDLILKDLLLALKTPQSVVNLLPDLKVTLFDLSIEPTSGSFSIDMTIAPVEKWTILTIGSMDVNMSKMAFAVEKYAANLQMSASGVFDLVTDKPSTVTLTAEYKDKSWHFTGVYDNPGGITINEVLAQYIPGIDQPSIPQLKIAKVLVNIVRGTTDDNKAYNTFNFAFSGELGIVDKLLITADINVLYDSRKASPYDGTKLQGTVTFGGLSFKALAKYSNGRFSNYEFELTFRGITAKATVVDTDKTRKFNFTLQSSDPNRKLTLGDVIASMIEAATGDPVSIPQPWSFILSIPLNNFVLFYEFNKETQAKTVGLTWPLNINLGFIIIEELSLLYSPDAGKKNGPVDFKVTKGKFLGIDINNLPQEDRPDWDLRDPSKAPAVPGLGNSAFKLEFLGLGNQVAIREATPPASVTQAITNLAGAFDDDKTDKLPPDLYFDKNYGVLFGAQFILIKYIRIAAIFYDPVMYGISIDVKDGKFKNLYFEILYKKVTENIGVYQIDLTLPDFVRQQQFGVVSVTLPSITLSIYTNGDFIIDMGFPRNGDFSRSFGLEFSIFTGAGGFYFGKLSNDTATMLPKGDGQFNPVIIFGIGIRAGLGRSLNKGPLKAELSLTLQVILEGVLAWYTQNHPDEKQEKDNEVLYYRLQAQAALVGRIYGEIDFVIISASLEVMVRILFQLVVEAYRQSLITFTAEVYAAVKVRINLGLFKITISCSFRTSISDTFRIGSNDPAPWDSGLLKDRNAYFTQMENITPEPVPPPMLWTAPLNYPKEEVNLLFLPQLSVRYDAAASNQKQAVAASLLFINTIPDSPDKTDFTVLCRAFMAWVFNAYFAAKGKTENNILDQPVTIEDVNAIFRYFDQGEVTTGEKDAFSVTDLYNYFFAQAFTSVNITTKQANQQNAGEEADQDVAFFPIIPLLQMMVNAGTPISFSEPKADPAYLVRIREYFAEMQVQYRERKPVRRLRNDEEMLSMAEFLFIDYFVMMARTGLQDIINGFKQTTLDTKEDDSLDTVARRYQHYGATAPSLAFANRHKPLKPAAILHIPGFTYRLRDNESLDRFRQQLPPQENVLLTAESGVVTVPSFLYAIPESNAPATLWTIAGRFGVDLDELAALNTGRPGLFATGTRLLHAFVETKTVKEILDELQSGAQYQMANIAGTVSRFFLCGLRIPAAITGDERIALYEGTRQQFNLSGAIDGQKVKLGVPDISPGWLKLGGDKSVQFDFNPAMAQAVAGLLSSTYVPGITLAAQSDVIRYRMEPRTFALATSYTWQDPNPRSARNTLGETFVWTFSAQLQQYLVAHNTIDYQLLVQSVNTPFSQTNAGPVTPLCWATFVTVKLRRVPAEAMPGNFIDNVYVVDGCGEADGSLLQQLLTAGSPPAINSLDILFADNSARENEGEIVNGLVSAALTQYTTFLLQTNYSTISNPGISAEDLAGMTTNNLLGMDAMTFLTYLWECSIVRSGGYYLYYRNNATGNGLPDYLFNTDGVGAVRILVSYTIPVQPDSGGYLLPAYVNTAVLDQEIDDRNDTLFAGIALTTAQRQRFDPVLQTMQSTILPGVGMFRGERLNPQSLLAAGLEESADQQLSELFQLMEYRILATTGVFRRSNFALPAGPLDNNDNVENCMSRLPVAMQTSVWNYSSVMPVYRFADTGQAGWQEDPYAANGKTATVYFNFLDIFGNTLLKDGSSGITQGITPGYTDPVIGIDQWINVTRTYKIAQATGGIKPELIIRLEFDKERYAQATDPEAAAQRDLKLYRQIALQLAQPGVGATVRCSIGTILPQDKEALQLLQEYITAIIAFLSQVKVNKQDDDRFIIANLLYDIDAAQLNAEFIFQLTVAIAIERTLYIDPQFEKEASVRLSTTIIPPNLCSGTTIDKTALTVFATDLEKSLPVMKVAVGADGRSNNANRKQGPAETDAKDIWLVRFATGTQAGISFTVDPLPVYFGVKPLATTLLARPDKTHTRPVPMRTYTPGAYIGNETAQQKTFAGVDMELMGRTFISAMDTFLSAQNSTRAWRIQQSGACEYFEKPFEAVEQAKRSISKTVAGTQLTNILQEGDFSHLPAAQAAMEQQMLVLMSNIYRTEAVVQATATVSQGYDQPSAHLYGQMVFADSDIPENTYYFTPVKISLTKGEQTLNTFFSVQQEAGSSGSGIDLIDRFKAGLDFQVTGVEHNFGTPINGYIPSSWLSFAIPVLRKGTGDKALVEADIPVPLKAYPTAPSLIGQEAMATPPDGGANGKDKLEQVLLWDYTFNYNYVTARQDLIYLDIQQNVQVTGGAKNLDETPDDPQDLFEALMQFTAAFEAVAADIAKEDAGSIIALQSFAWLVQQVAHTWPDWFGLKAAEKAGKKSLNYIISEEPEQGTGILLVTIQHERHSDSEELPWIAIDGFKTIAYPVQDGKQTYYFVQVTSTSETPLLFADRKRFGGRIVLINRNNVLVEENAWAGVAIHRNEILAGKPANVAFRYITPYIRFADACYPSLDNQDEINIADFTPGAGPGNKKPLDMLLLNFFKELLKSDLSREVMLQMQAGYSYVLQADAAPFQLGPALPIVMLPPVSVTGAAITEILDPLSDAICNWFATYDVAGRDTTGSVSLVIALFAATSGDMHHPVLTLRGVYLPSNVIDFNACNTF